MPKGSWGGLTCTTIGKLMGCSHTHACTLLHKKRVELNRDLTLDDIGNLIYAYRGTC